MFDDDYHPEHEVQRVAEVNQQISEIQKKFEMYCQALERYQIDVYQTKYLNNGVPTAKSSSSLQERKSFHHLTTHKRLIKGWWVHADLFKLKSAKHALQYVKFSTKYF